MPRRSYGQLCPIASALDLVGERWTLLVVRELLLGPKRFSDLQVGLPGIGSNILSARLKELEAASVVSRRRLPPPAASWVYELTGRGRELGDIVLRLGHWGVSSSAFRQSDGIARPEWTVLSLYARYHPSAATAGPTSVELRFGDETYSARIDEGELTIGRGAATSPDLIVSLDHDTLNRIFRSKGSERIRVASGVTIVEGSQDAFESFLRHFT